MLVLLSFYVKKTEWITSIKKQHDTRNGVSIYTAGRMHSIGESMHTARFGMIFYLLI